MLLVFFLFTAIVCGAHRKCSKTKRFLFDFVTSLSLVCVCLVGFSLRAHTIFEHSSFLLPFKFRLIEYYMVNIAASVDLS